MILYTVYVTKAGAPWDTAARGVNPVPTLSWVYADGTPYGVAPPVVVDAGLGFYTASITHPGGAVPLLLRFDADPLGGAGFAADERYIPSSCTRDDGAATEARLVLLEGLTTPRAAALDLVTLARAQKVDEITATRMGRLDTDFPANILQTLGLAGHKNNRVFYSNFITILVGPRRGMQMPQVADVYIYGSAADAQNNVAPTLYVTYRFVYDVNGDVTEILSYQV